MVFYALCLGIYSWYLHREHKYCEDLYSKTYNKLQSLELFEGKFHLSQKLMSTLLHPHPESVVLRDFSVEEYRQPALRYFSHYKSDSYIMYGDGGVYSYTMYGDGRIVYKQINKKEIIWPKSKEHLSNIFSNDADLLWLYLEIYQKLRKGKVTQNKT